jgi:SOS-response transcriptional repressor LexA
MGMTQDQVASKVGISKPYLSNIETGKAKNPPSDGVLRSLERVLSFKPDELMRVGHLERTPRDIRERYESLRAELRKIQAVARDKGQELPALEPGMAEDIENIGPEVSAGIVVPVLNSVAAGYPHHFTDLDYPPGVADEYIRCPDIHDPQAFAARIVGDSMEPQYRQGDIVVFSPRAVAGNGDDCFVRFAPPDEGTTFKRIFEDSAETLRLQPLNNQYPSQVVGRDKVNGLWPATFRIQPIRRP